jgi:hypothetical protein
MPNSVKRSTDTIDYQKRLFGQVSKIFEPVEYEWRAFKTGDKHRYGPRLDIAVGPFNDEAAPENLTSHYNEMVSGGVLNRFLKRAYDYHILNLDSTIYEEVIHPGFLEVIERNQNARCLMSFEIENKNTRKHILGSVVNAASLGRVGIGIGFPPDVTETFLRILNYLSFLKNVEKNGYDTCNFLVLTIDQMEALIQNIHNP